MSHKDLAALDRITLSGVSAVGYHGVLEEERREGQRFSADVTLFLDLREASSSDDLTNTADYAAIAVATVACIEGAPHDLIESLAQRIADAVLEISSAYAVEVTVNKPKAPIPIDFENVAVTIIRYAR